MATPLTPIPMPPVEGASFSRAAKLIATGCVALLVLNAVTAIQTTAWVNVNLGQRLFLLATLAVVLTGYWGIMTSRTRFDGQTIRQTWLWPKTAAIAEITQVKLINPPALAWLIAPRLVVRIGNLRITTFHAADPAVLAALRRFAYGEA